MGIAFKHCVSNVYVKVGDFILTQNSDASDKKASCDGRLSALLVTMISILVNQHGGTKLAFHLLSICQTPQLGKMSS